MYTLKKTPYGVEIQGLLETSEVDAAMNAAAALLRTPLKDCIMGYGSPDAIMTITTKGLKEAKNEDERQSVHGHGRNLRLWYSQSRGASSQTLLRDLIPLIPGLEEYRCFAEEKYGFIPHEPADLGDWGRCKVLIEAVKQDFGVDAFDVLPETHWAWKWRGR